MVQATDIRIENKKIDAVLARRLKVKVPTKGSDKIASPSSAETVQYASLPGRFKSQPRGSSLLVAQARKGGKSTKVTRCIPGISKAPTKRRIRKLTSNVKLGTSKLYYSLRLQKNGVDAIIQQGSQIFRVPLDVKASWDAKRRKVVIDGKTLKSSKLVNTALGPRLQFDQKELARLVKPQMDAIAYEMDNRIRSSWLSGYDGDLKKVDGILAKVKRQLGHSFKKDSRVRRMRKHLVKRYGILKALLVELGKQRRRIARLRRKKGFTKAFYKKLKSLKRQNAKLKGLISALRSKLWKIIYKYWLKDKRVRKRPC